MSTFAPRLYRTYVALISLVGVVLVAGAATSVPDRRAAALLTLAAFVAVLAPARIRSNAQVSLVTVVIFTAILAASPQAVLLTSVGAATGALVVSPDPRPARFGFNLGQFSLAALAALLVKDLSATSGVFESVAGVGSLPGLGLLVAMSFAYTFVNLTLMAGILWVTVGEPVRSTLGSFFGSAATLQVVYVLLAVVAWALITVDASLALVFLLVPLMVARAGLVGFQEQDEATDRMVKAFVKALEVKDGYTRGHAERVAGLTEKVAAEMGFSYEERRMAGYAALLHDIGKIGVPTAVITKRGPLDDEEFAAIKRHPTVGAEMLRDIDFLVPALDVVRHHHERYDGRGYPYGLAGERIPPLARMVSAVDAFDAMTSTRSYRKALPVDVALRELDRCAGTQFDVDAVKALKKVIEREGWELTTDPVGEVVSRAGQVRALAREVVSEAAG